MASSVSTMTTDSASASVPPATPTSASANNLSTPVPSSSSSSSVSSSLKRTVVTAKRKEELLLEARAERKQWIRTIPLPFDPELLLFADNNNQKADGKTKAGATNRLWSSREGLDRFQSSLVFRDRLLQGTTSILSELYGIGSALNYDDDGVDVDVDVVFDVDVDVDVDAGEEKDDISDGDGGEDGKNCRKQQPPNRPLSVDDVADRVERLTKPFMADEEKEGHSSSSFIDNKNNDNTAGSSVDGVQGDGEKAIRDDRYKNVRTAYEEFVDAMLLPESAVTVQGMKNFVRQFAAVPGSKKEGEEDDDDKLVRNLASIVNSQIRSSYESLATKNNIIATASEAQAQGQPDWDRRSLESFLYGQVKPVVDTTLDRILGNSETPPSPSSPFLMTQKSFDKRLEELQFLQPSHLELKCLSDDSDASTSQTNLDSLLDVPIKALQSIESFFSPYEKLCRVLDVYHGVNVVLKNASKALPMADDVISAMILVIVKASAARTKPNAKTSNKTSLKNLLRDLHFVENFALQEYKRVGGGEVEYAFTSLYGAVYFLQGVELDFDRDESSGGSNRLCISNEELRRGLEQSQALAAKNNAKWNAATGNSNEKGGKPKGLIGQGIAELLGGSEPDGIGYVGTGVSNFVPNPRQLSVREVRAARLRGEILDLEWALRRQEGQQGGPKQVSEHAETSSSSPAKSLSRSVFTPQRYTFLGVRPESIKLSDLPRLLDEYRKLVLANEQLLGEHQRANNKVQSERKRLRDEKHRRALGEQALLF